MPADNGFLIEVAVFKELEDLTGPERATASRAAVRNGASLDSNRERAPLGQPGVVWIPLGRDISLEQQMLIQIRARLAN